MHKCANSQMLLEFTAQIRKLKSANSQMLLVTTQYFIKICSEFSIDFFKKVRRPFIYLIEDMFTS